MGLSPHRHGLTACTPRAPVSCLSRISGFSGPGLCGLRFWDLHDPPGHGQPSLCRNGRLPAFSACGRKPTFGAGVKAQLAQSPVCPVVQHQTNYILLPLALCVGQNQHSPPRPHGPRNQL